MFEGLSSSGSDCPSELSASGASGSGLRAKAFDDAFEGDPIAASSKGKDKGQSVDLMLSDASGDDSNRVPSDFSTMSEGCGPQDPDLAPPLLKQGWACSDDAAKSRGALPSEIADQLGLFDAVGRKKMRRSLLNHKRHRKKMASRHRHTSDALVSLSASYNKGKLRIGDMADPDWERRKQRPDHGRRAHPKAWSLSGTIDFAFSSIGALSRNFTTRRPVDAIASVALAARAHQEDSLRAWSRFIRKIKHKENQTHSTHRYAVFICGCPRTEVGQERGLEGLNRDAILHVKTVFWRTFWCSLGLLGSPGRARSGPKIRHQYGFPCACLWFSRFYLPASGHCKWVCMTRAHDSTPIKIRFGQLRELQQVARFWCKQGKLVKGKKAASMDEWKLLTWEDIQHTAGALPSHGIVELMAQRGCIAWPEQRGAFVAHQRRDLFFPPKFLQQTNGSTIFACMQQASGK